MPVFKVQSCKHLRLIIGDLVKQVSSHTCKREGLGLCVRFVQTCDVCYLSWYGPVVPCVAPGLITVHLQLLFQLSTKLLWGTVQDELVPGELQQKHTGINKNTEHTSFSNLFFSLTL